MQRFRQNEMAKRTESMKIGRYELVTLLGEGGMARAYLAVSRGPIGFDKLVVVKQVRPEFAHDGEFLTMFFDEARIASRLNHPNVVQTYEALEHDGQYLLAMEFLEGKTLTEVLRRVGRSDMPLEDHLWILAQILSGLHYAHEVRDYDGTPLDVVHRDVSPSNVFITYNGEVKLLDFGIAKAEGALAHTRTGVVKGKVAYGAPEQFAGQRVDRRADIFSVGVMLWEALARQRRHVSDSPVELFQAVCGGGLRDIRHVNPNAPALLAEICGRATASDPTDRYPSAAEFLDDLDIYLASARRVERRNVASLMARFFDDDRQKLAKRIEDQLGATRYVFPRQAAHPSSRAPTMPDRPPPNALDVAAAGSGEPKRSRRFVRRYVVVAGFLAAFGPLALFSKVQRWGASFTEPVAAAITPPIAEAKPAPGMTARVVVAPAVVARNDRAPPFEKPDTIRLSIKVEPPSATLELDGLTLNANPFRGEVQRASTGSHWLRAVAPGYQPFERPISLARDVNVIFGLRPITARVPRAQKPADNSGRRPTPWGDIIEIEPADLKRIDAPRSGPAIDRQNPYAP
jgi:serine/threonine-protein kinase